MKGGMQTRRAGGGKNSDSDWANALIEDCYESPLMRLGAESLRGDLKITIGRTRGVMGVAVVFPAIPFEMAPDRSTRPRTRVVHRPTDTSLQAEAAAGRAASLIKRFAFIERMNQEIDPHGMIDDDRSLGEMHCAGMMTRFLALHGVDIGQLALAAAEPDRTYGWNVGADACLAEHVDDLKDLPPETPPFSFTTNEGWISDFRTRLTHDIVLRNDMIVLQGSTMPETHISGMRGMRADDVVRHPIFASPTLTVRSVRNHRLDTQIRLDMRDDGDIVAGYGRYLPDASKGEAA